MKQGPTPEANVTPLRRQLGVVLIDPLPVVRAGLGLLIRVDGGMEVLATCGTGVEGLASVGRIRRSRVVVLVGLGLDGPHDAAWPIAAIRDRTPSHAVLALGANGDATAISHALYVGADGYVDKRLPPERFLDEIRRAGMGEMVLAGPDAASAGDIAVAIDRRRDLDATLTERELQVLAVAAEGLTARQIAERLGVRERTVTTHLSRIYGKLGVGNRLAAIRSAARSGLVAAAAE